MERPKEKQRHGCLTAFLVVFALFGVIGIGKSLISPTDWSKTYADAPAWLTPVLTVLGIANLACLWAVFKWKKIGFWGACVLTLVNLPIQWMIGTHMVIPQTGKAVSPLFFVVPPIVIMAIYYLALQIGNDENKGWPQLE